MAIVKVWNDNKYDHKENFKGIDLVVPAGKFIEMEYEDAIDFKGQFTPPAPHDCKEDPAKYYKMIRVENPPPGAIYKEEGLINHATGQKAASAAELMAALRAFAEANPDRVVKDEKAEKAQVARDAEVETLKAQVAELSKLVGQKKKPGPKPKGAVA